MVRSRRRACEGRVVIAGTFQYLVPVGPILLSHCYVTALLCRFTFLVLKMRLSTSYLQHGAADKRPSRYRKPFKAVRLIAVIDSQQSRCSP